MSMSNYGAITAQLAPIVTDCVLKYVNGLSEPELEMLIGLAFAPCHSVSNGAVMSKWNEAYKSHASLASLVSEIGHLTNCEINSGQLSKELCQAYLKGDRLDKNDEIRLGQFALALMGHRLIPLIPSKLINQLKRGK